MGVESSVSVVKAMLLLVVVGSVTLGGVLASAGRAPRAGDRRTGAQNSPDEHGGMERKENLI